MEKTHAVPIIGHKFMKSSSKLLQINRAPDLQLYFAIQLYFSVQFDQGTKFGVILPEVELIALETDLRLHAGKRKRPATLISDYSLSRF